MECWRKVDVEGKLKKRIVVRCLWAVVPRHWDAGWSVLLMFWYVGVFVCGCFCMGVC